MASCMTSVRVVPARKAGDRILCGVRDTAGRFVCQGKIATIARVPGPGMYIGPRVKWPPGMVEDPPGSGMWRANPRGHDRRNKTMVYPWLPASRPCPHCGTLAEITDDLLTS
jgi:hypothetical protein